MSGTPSPETLALLERLIAFDTVSAHSNRAMIDFVADYLGTFGIEAQVLPSPDGNKASLWATIGPAIAGGIVLSGHSDVVPEVLALFEARMQEAIIAQIRRDHPTVTATTRIFANALALAPEPEGLAETLAKQLLGTNQARAVAFAAEAGQYQRAGLSTVIIGPGSIDQAHIADEYIDLDQLAACETFLRKLSDELTV